MRSVELAVFADDLAAEAAVIAAHAERARSRLRATALEREARRALRRETVDRLEALGVLGRWDERAVRAELRELVASLVALEELQAWVEAELARCAA